MVTIPGTRWGCVAGPGGHPNWERSADPRRWTSRIICWTSSLADSPRSHPLAYDSCRATGSRRWDGANWCQLGRPWAGEPEPWRALHEAVLPVTCSVSGSLQLLDPFPLLPQPC